MRLAVNVAWKPIALLLAGLALLLKTGTATSAGVQGTAREEAATTNRDGPDPLDNLFSRSVIRGACETSYRWPDLRP